MTSAMRCLVLLACVGVCAAAVIRPDCQCVRFSRTVNPSLIANVLVLKPRPYCSREEIIVLLKDGTKRCLDPNERFAKAVVKTKEEMARRATRRSVADNTTTAITTNVTMTTAAMPTPSI